MSATTAAPSNLDMLDPEDPRSQVITWVGRAKSGDTEAFGLIYDRYLDTVFRYACSRCKGDRALAEDITSKTFLRALQGIHNFTWQGRDLGAWLCTIARNIVIDHRKSKCHQLEITTGDVHDITQTDRSPEGRPESTVLDHLSNVALLSAVSELTLEQRECVVLRFIHGFSIAETSQIMGKTVGAVKTLQYRAVRALARLLPDGFQS